MRLLLALLFTVAQSAGVVRTADPIKRGLKESDFPRTVKVADNVYTYEDFHAGDEKFTTTNLFVVTNAGVTVADGPGNPYIVHPTSKAILDRSASSGRGAGVWKLPADAVLAPDKQSFTLGGQSF